MLNQNTVATLSKHTLRTDAHREICLLPLGGIYWDDEMPDVREMIHIPEEERNLIFRLFGMRVKLWRNERLIEDEQQIWDAVRTQVPSWAFWHRSRITDEDKQAQIDAEHQTEEELAQFFADADEVSITEKDGMQSFSATFKLSKDSPATRSTQSLWKRLLHKLRLI